MAHGKFQLRKIIAMMIFKTNTDYTISRPLKEYLHMVLLCLCLAYFFGFTQSLAGEFTTLDMSKVKVGGEVGRHINQTIYNNLLAIDVERDFLSQFREPHDKQRLHPNDYFGLGKLIDASVKFAYYTGDNRVLAFKNRLVNETIKCQMEDGYIGAFRPQDRVIAAWDLHEMVYIIYGLTSEYHYFKNQNSLNAAVKLANYVIEHRPPKVYVAPNIGQERAFVALYNATNDKKYIDYLVEDGIITPDPNGVPEGHCYTQLGISTAMLELYPILHNQSLFDKAHNIVQFLTKQDGMLITGSCSSGECWHSDQQGRGGVVETCATAYEIRFLNTLIQLEGNSLYGDIMERAIYNALFAAQSPDGRYLRYHTSVEGRRVYFDRDTYCCPGNFRRIIAELPEMIYYKADKGIAINLYTASQAELTLSSGLTLKISQETEYPASGKVLLRLEPAQAATFPVLLRIPRWCREIKISVNGTPIKETITPGTFFNLTRNFKQGDEIHLEMTMDWRFVKGRKVNEGLVALMRGPSLFCLALNRIRQWQQCGLNDASPMSIKPDTLKGPYTDNSYRPGGLISEIEGLRPGEGEYPAWGCREMIMQLTEYVDPAGEMVYFKLLEPTNVKPVDDELIFKPSKTGG